jgi:digeranylgeranylglycerophospholipid reductase
MDEILTREYDVVVVGAGPAGSFAARALAEKGVRTLVVDKRQEIGAPKRCAEGISCAGMTKAGITPDRIFTQRKASRGQASGKQRVCR